MPDEGSRLIAPPLYRVTAKDGRDIAYTAEQKGSVLTVRKGPYPETAALK